jgi:hypothetical protein
VKVVGSVWRQLVQEAIEQSCLQRCGQLGDQADAGGSLTISERSTGQKPARCCAEKRHSSTRMQRYTCRAISLRA